MLRESPEPNFPYPVDNCVSSFPDAWLERQLGHWESWKLPAAHGITGRWAPNVFCAIPTPGTQRNQAHRLSRWWLGKPPHASFNVRKCWFPEPEGQPPSRCHRAGCQGKAVGNGIPPHSCVTWGPGEEWRGECKGNNREQVPRLGETGLGEVRELKDHVSISVLKAHGGIVCQQP